MQFSVRRFVWFRFWVITVLWRFCLVDDLNWVLDDLTDWTAETNAWDQFQINVAKKLDCFMIKKSNFLTIKRSNF
jgi:hypothetical protein